MYMYIHICMYIGHDIVPWGLMKSEGLVLGSVGNPLHSVIDWVPTYMYIYIHIIIHFRIIQLLMCTLVIYMYQCRKERAKRTSKLLHMQSTNKRQVTDTAKIFVHELTSMKFQLLHEYFYENWNHRKLILR